MKDNNDGPSETGEKLPPPPAKEPYPGPPKLRELDDDEVTHVRERLSEETPPTEPKPKRKR